MPKVATGQVLQHANGFSARVRVAAGANDRPSFALALRTEAEAVARTELLASIAKRLRGVIPPSELAELLTIAGAAATPKALAAALEAVDAIADGTTTKTASAIAPTFEKFAEEWTMGRLRAKHPDHVREKDSTRDEELLRLYINPEIGPLRVPDVTLERVERVMARLPAELSPATRRHVAQCARKVLSLAVYPGRHIASNPIPREWMPKVPKSSRKAKAFLYPDEDAKLMRCTAVAIERRIAYGIQRA